MCLLGLSTNFPKVILIYLKSCMEDDTWTRVGPNSPPATAWRGQMVVGEPGWLSSP